MLRRFLNWFFEDRQTGKITIAQMPNLALWIAIGAGTLLLVWPPPGHPGVALEVLYKGAFLFWAVDEIFRGVNPWRRCLGAAVFSYVLATIL